MTEKPSVVTEYTDNESPEGSPVFRQGPQANCDDMTRRILAIITVSIVGFLYVAIFVSFLVKLIDYVEFNEALAAMPGPLALAAIALLFFFRGKAITSKVRKVLEALS